MHRPDLVAYAGRVLGTGGEGAEDLVQEAYLRLLERTSAGLGPADVRPWLFRVVRNLALDERRRVGRWALPLAEGAAGARAGDPGDALERREEAGLVLRQVAALPPRERRAVELDQAGLEAPAIARALDTSPNAVHQALFRARRRLRRARAAGWGLAPLPLARLMLRASDGRVPEAVLAAGAPGSAPGRLIPAAGLAGAVLAGLAGGGAVVHSLHQAMPAPATAAIRRAAPAAASPAPRARRVMPPAAPVAPRRSAAVPRRADPRPARPAAVMVAARAASPAPPARAAVAAPDPTPAPPAPVAPPAPPPPPAAAPPSATGHRDGGGGDPRPPDGPPATAQPEGPGPPPPAASAPPTSEDQGAGSAQVDSSGPGPSGPGPGPDAADGADGASPAPPGASPGSDRPG